MNLLRRARWALLGGLTAVLVACGPGVGGTGTGYGSEPGIAGLAWFDAQPRSVCEGPLATLAQCVAPAVGLPPVPGGPVRLAGACAAATLDADEIVLDVICGGWVFAGRWGLGTEGVGRYYGLYGADPMQAPTAPATLDVQSEPGSGRVMFWLRDGHGDLVAGPLVLEPAGLAALRRSE